MKYSLGDINILGTIFHLLSVYKLLILVIYVLSDGEDERETAIEVDTLPPPCIQGGDLP